MVLVILWVPKKEYWARTAYLRSFLILEIIPEQKIWKDVPLKKWEKISKGKKRKDKTRQDKTWHDKKKKYKLKKRGGKEKKKETESKWIEKKSPEKGGRERKWSKCRA